MSGTGKAQATGMIRKVEASPVSYLTCPRCDFPLNVYFHEIGGNGEKKINTHVACCRCMWAENWGELKIHAEEEKKDAERTSA